MIDLRAFTHLTFDCYGTLIDWESGILDALAPLVARRGRRADEARLLELYARHEAELEAGPYLPYREILRRVTAAICEELGASAGRSELEALADSVGSWPPFDDTVEALTRLKRGYKLVILSNIDDALFAGTARRLRVEFDEVITAERVGSYKPALENFRFALRCLGVGSESVLHVAQSLFHDHVPAKRLGLRTAWINRPSQRPGTGVAPAARARPDLELPDLASLADAAGL